MSESKSRSVGLGGMVFCVFLFLKLSGHIDWSWWWVTAPLWLPITAILGFMLLIFLLAAILGK